MTGERGERRGARETRALLTRPVAAALTGRADPAPRDRPWPVGLRWTRRTGVGRLPFGTVAQAVAQAVDLVVAVSLLSTGYSRLIHEARLHTSHHSSGALFLLALAAVLPLALRQRHPLGAWRMSAAVTVVVAFLPWLPGTYLPHAVVVALLCLYQVAARGPRDVTVGVGMVSVVGVWVLAPPKAAVAVALLLVPLLWGHLVRQRRVARRELAEQERRHRETEVLHTERQRIARELHDVVAHHMSMIAIQAEAAPYKVPGMHGETRRDLSEIRSTALDALTEMRRILGVLRSQNGAETAPQPGLERLDELVSNARNAGLHLTTTADGDLADLPQGVGLTAYRILQEALSNAMRHAPGSRVELDVAHTGGVLCLKVVNGPPADGHRPTPSPPGTGHGLTGMRERTSMLGGSLTAGPTPEGGFAVTAALPVRERAT
ncbi:hypothetical protein GCM10009678_92560 [Actinomadura kijaniata]|uniref:histidine kinase n=1 Tax=Actinomadura namibiensis TaxID=182080 RepID=A0A7W3LPC8_ACTNM|nr:sensor histidine kinase [Actinomadura namibiensis]MBA8951815.1 signal transduction histidine kinase [Actinomadura namibiensis]